MTKIPDASKKDIKKIYNQIEHLHDRTEGPASNWLLTALDALEKALEKAK